MAFQVRADARAGSVQEDALISLRDPEERARLLRAPALHVSQLDHLPPQFHLVLASRVDPPLPLSRLRARHQLVELRADDLRFTLAEAATFLNEIMGFRVDFNLIKMIDRQDSRYSYRARTVTADLSARF